MRQVGQVGRVSRVAPDVVLFGAAWPSRALIRAQLIEEGLEVVAVEAWTEMRRWLQPGMKPRAAILDLKDVDEPSAVLTDLSALMRPERVLVIAAEGTVPGADIERLGFLVMSRPVSVDALVKGVGRIVRAAGDSDW